MRRGRCIKARVFPFAGEGPKERRAGIAADFGHAVIGDDFDQILRAAQRGEARAFDVLYASLNTRVAAYASARGASDSERVVNDVFLQVFRKLSDFSGPEPAFNAWVFRIARNKLIDERRRRDRRPVEVSLEDARVEHHAAEDPIGDESVRLLLARLTADQRDVVVLRVVVGLTIAEVAASLGKPESAVKALQRRAFRTIARHLENEGVSR